MVQKKGEEKCRSADVELGGGAEFGEPVGDRPDTI